MTPRWVVKRAPSGRWWWAISPHSLYWGFPSHADAIEFVDLHTRSGRPA